MPTTLHPILKLTAKKCQFLICLYGLLLYCFTHGQVFTTGSSLKKPSCSYRLSPGWAINNYMQTPCGLKSLRHSSCAPYFVSVLWYSLLCMSTLSGPLAAAELSSVASSLPLPCPITMTITDKNIYYVGSPLPVPANISQGSGSSLSPSKASFS